MIAIVAAAFVGALAAPLTVPQCTELPPGEHDVALPYPGSVERSTIVNIPPQAARRGPLPVVVNLHGATNTNPLYSDNTAAPELSREKGVLVLSPRGVARVWGNSEPSLVDDVTFLQWLAIDYVETVLCLPVDHERVFVMGYSVGGSMSLRLAVDGSGTFKAIASVGGFLTDTTTGPVVDPSVRVLIYHGINDTTIPYASGEAASRRFDDLLGCAPSDGVEIFRNGSVSCQEWECANGSVKAFCSEVGGAHSWPGCRGELGTDPPQWGCDWRVTRDMDATFFFWDWFNRLV